MCFYYDDDGNEGDVDDEDVDDGDYLDANVNGEDWQ